MHNIWKYNSQLDLINDITREIYGDYLTHFFEFESKQMQKCQDQDS